MKKDEIRIIAFESVSSELRDVEKKIIDTARQGQMILEYRSYLSPASIVKLEEDGFIISNHYKGHHSMETENKEGYCFIQWE